MTSTRQAAPSGAAALPAPWGSPPTPLLPRWYIDSLAPIPLPWTLLRAAASSQTSAAKLRTVNDLPRFWEHRTEPITDDVQHALVHIVTGLPLPIELTVLPADMHLAHLLTLPLQTRTRNCILRAFGYRALREGQAVTVAQLMQLPNFGLISLLDLMCVTEATFGSPPSTRVGTDDTQCELHEPLTAALSLPLDDPTQWALRDSTEGLRDLPLASVNPQAAVGDPAADLSNLPPAQPEPQQAAWKSATALLEQLLGAASEFRGARTLGDALAINLGGLASTLRLMGDLQDIPISDLAAGQSLAYESLVAVANFRKSLSPLELLILEQRLLASHPRTLEEIARTSNLSRERIRQLQKRLESAIESAVGRRLEIIAALVRQQLGPVIAESEIEERISSTFPSTTSPDGTESATDLARHMLRAELDYSAIGGVCLSKEATAVVEELQTAARSLADDVGLIEEADLRTHLPNDEWHQHWDVLLARCDLHRFSGRLALRDTAKARAKAALLEIGRPATKEEVASLCGLDRNRTGAQLSLLAGVVRADKVHWGLAEWVEDEYEGIPAEIIQRIHEDGGATTLQRLLEELPRMFGVSEGSVRSYAGTPRFLLRDGYVSLADESSIALRSLDDVMHGRDVDGARYWTFKVEDRYFDGYSLVGLPPEIAKALGCEPNGRTRVRVSYPDDCGDLSVSWRLSSLSGASLGYLSEPLRKLGVQDGDRVRLVLDGPGYVSLHRESPDNAVPSESHDPDAPSQHPPSEGSSSDDRAREFLERMKNRRRGL